MACVTTGRGSGIVRLPGAAQSQIDGAWWRSGPEETRQHLDQPLSSDLMPPVVGVRRREPQMCIRAVTCTDGDRGHEQASEPHIFLPQLETEGRQNEETRA